MKNIYNKLVAVLALSAASVGAFSQSTSTGPDLSSLTSSVYAQVLINEVLIVATIFAIIYITARCAKILFRLIRGS